MPIIIDKSVDLWIKLVSNSQGLEWAAWLAWFTSLSVAITILAAIYYFYFIRKNKKFVTAAIISGLAVTLLVEVLKRIFLRLRPDGSDFFSFPSRHAALAFLLATLMILENPKSKIRLLLVPWAVAVAFSRLWLEQHYLSDVLAGGLIGVVFAFGFYRYFYAAKIKRK